MAQEARLDDCGYCALCGMQWLWDKPKLEFCPECHAPSEQEVWILRAKGVYWQGIYGVFDTCGEAVEHAELLAEENDGWHSLVISRFGVGYKREADEKLRGRGRWSETSIVVDSDG